MLNIQHYLKQNLLWTDIVCLQYIDTKWHNQVSSEFTLMYIKEYINVHINVYCSTLMCTLMYILYINVQRVHLCIH